MMNEEDTVIAAAEEIIASESITVTLKDAVAETFAPVIATIVEALGDLDARIAHIEQGRRL